MYRIVVRSMACAPATSVTPSPGRYILYTFNEGFTEQVGFLLIEGELTQVASRQDELWIPDVRKSDARVPARAVSVLNDIWDRYPVTYERYPSGLTINLPTFRQTFLLPLMGDLLVVYWVRSVGDPAVCQREVAAFLVDCISLSH